MSPFRFSPIKSEIELRQALEYLHAACFALAKKACGRYLPIAGNIGVFCHYDDEFSFLTDLRERLTDSADNWNQKYYRLLKPLAIPAQGDLPAATYTYLYIRRPDPQAPEVGDIDFVATPAEHRKLKELAEAGEKADGVGLLYRPDLDMIRLSQPGIDALPYITTKTILESMGKSWV